MKHERKIYWLLSLLTIIGTSCKDDREEEPGNAGKPVIQVTVEPQTGLNYGDALSVEGSITDDNGLYLYGLTLEDATGNILYAKEQMLTGNRVDLHEKIVIPLPKNASEGTLKLSVTARNTRRATETLDFPLSDLQVPVFDRLYLRLNNTVVEMTKRGNVFEAEDFFAAGAKGVIGVSPESSGLYWGVQNGEVTSMGGDSIPVGGEENAMFKITFDPSTFELQFGDRETWTPLDETDCYYVLGNISGHWADGNITTEKAKMKMKGFRSGNKRYYSWRPPAGDDPETGMWEYVNAGSFRFKKGGDEAYLLWDGTALVAGTENDESRSFELSVLGTYEFRVFFEDERCTKVQVAGDIRSLEYGETIKVNGRSVSETIDCCGAPVARKPGKPYTYESVVTLQQGQKVRCASIDLAKATGDADLFSGIGNPEWTLQGPDGPYTIRIDLFSGSFYACPRIGYPDVIYMDGWSWAKTETDGSVTWDVNRLLPLIRVKDGTYQSTFYDFGWGGNCKLYVKHPLELAAGSVNAIPNTMFADSKYIDKATSDAYGLPYASAPGYFRICVDLKDGLVVSDDGTVRMEAAGGKKFTIDFEKL